MPCLGKLGRQPGGLFHRRHGGSEIARLVFRDAEVIKDANIFRYCRKKFAIRSNCRRQITGRMVCQSLVEFILSALGHRRTYIILMAAFRLSREEVGFFEEFAGLGTNGPVVVLFLQQRQLVLGMAQALAKGASNGAEQDESQALVIFGQFGKLFLR